MKFRVVFLLCLVLFSALELRAETLLSETAGDLQFSLRVSGTRYELELTSLSGELDPTTLTLLALENPSRLVVDLPGQWGARPSEYQLHRSDINALRLGVHADKIRLVADLSQAPAPWFEQQNRRGSVIVNFAAAPPDSLINSDSASVSARVTEPAVNEPTVVEPTVEEPTIAEPATGASMEAVAVNTANSKVSGVIVDGILFAKDPHKGRPAVQISVRNLGEYTLSKQKENLYLLSLSGATLAGENLSLPQFPPTEYVGLEVVMAEQRENAAQISMYVEAGTFLTPYRQGDKLWVRVGK